MVDPRQKNISIWEDIYNSHESNLSYPDENLVRISHRLFQKETHAKILDYGFGSGSNLIHLAQKGFELHGVEISETAIRNLKDKLSKMDMPAHLHSIRDKKIPYEDQFFDVVVAWQVLYYNDWSSLEMAIKEIDRILRPGGIFLGTMGAIGDFSHRHSNPLGDSIFESTVPGQEGAIVMIVEQDQLYRCFKNKNITIGKFGFEYDDRQSHHWVISYVKE
ncbi:class I SAM-dependent methyltransferase [Paenibacillus sepulcri]|uniref:Class I SAM-dependent methyltransferase n=1 Tax=Paenibacillus sepulcri TaxID=359917 RepID=A0ABS7BV33_9BACL|nr:class I SAM-dependent methyltransferase [Paenibacillus sepulcri]